MRRISVLLVEDHTNGREAYRLISEFKELTSRELEVLRLVAESYSNKQTAAELGISIKTVEKHRANLMNKLNIHDTAGLTRYAIGTGVIEVTQPMGSCGANWPGATERAERERLASLGSPYTSRAHIYQLRKPQHLQAGSAA